MNRWHISYKAITENWPDDITWSVELCGSLAEVINQLYKLDKVTEVIDIYEI